MNIADKTIFNVLAKSSEAFLLLVSSIVLARYLSKSDYGTFLQIMLVANTTIMLTFLGLPQSIYYYFQHVTNQSRFVIHNIILSLVIGATAALLTYFLRGILSEWLNNSLLIEYGWITALIVFFRAPSSLREPMLVSHGSLLLNSFATLLCNLIIYIPATIAAMSGESLERILIIMLYCAGGELIVYLCLTIRLVFLIRNLALVAGNKLGKLKDVSLRRQLVYALPIGLSSYMGILSRQIDQYIISVFFTPTDFAVYSRGAMRIPVLSNIQFTVNNIMMPKYVDCYRKKDKETFLYYFHLCIEKVAKINFPVFSFLFAVAPSVITLLYTKEYVESAYILRCYLFFLILNIAVYGIIPRASGKTGCILHATLISLACNVALSLVLVKLLGAIGAAIATIGSMLIASYYYLIQSCKILRVSFKKIFPWRFLVKLFLITSLASIPVYVVEYFYQPEGIYLFWVLGGEWLLYCYLCMLLMMRQGLIYHEDMELLERWFRFDIKKFLFRISFIRDS